MSRKPVDLFDCERVGSYIDSYLLGQVPPPERRGMRQHIHGCEACFAKVAARDPLQLFAPLADQTQPDEFWEGFWPAISEGIVRHEAGRQSRHFWNARRVWMRAAVVALAVAGVAAALILAPRIMTKPAAVVSSLPVPSAPISEASVNPAPPPMPETVEQVRTEGQRDVQVYTMSYTKDSLQSSRGAAPVAELVLIVDKGLKL